MIQDDIGHTFDPAMAGNSYRRKSGLFRQESIDCDKTFDSPLPEHSGVRCEQFLVVAVSYRKKEEILLPQVMFDAAHHQRTVGVPDFLQNHSNRMGALNPQRTR